MDILRNSKEKPRILLVEDNPGDIRLTQEVFSKSSLAINMDVVTDGEMALEFLFKKGKFADAVKPDIILLDLNLPKKNGLDVLKVVKADTHLKRIPIIVLTTSDAEHDISNAYSNHANCYILKPLDFDDFTQIIKLIESFWFNTVQLNYE